MDGVHLSGKKPQKSRGETTRELPGWGQTVGRPPPPPPPAHQRGPPHRDPGREGLGAGQGEFAASQAPRHITEAGAQVHSPVCRRLIWDGPGGGSWAHKEHGRAPGSSLSEEPRGVGTAAEQPGLCGSAGPWPATRSSGLRGPSLTVLETAGPGRLLRRPTRGSRSPATLPSPRETSWHMRKGLKLRDAGWLTAALSSGCRNGCPRRLSGAAGGTFRTSAGPRGGGGGTAGLLRLPWKVTVRTRWPVRTRASWDPPGGAAGRARGQRRAETALAVQAGAPQRPRAQAAAARPPLQPAPRQGRRGRAGRRGLTARSARSGAAAGASSC